MKQFIQRLFLACLLCALLYLAVGTAVRIRQGGYQVSFYENRSLAAFPELTAATVWDGSFFTRLEDYLLDHLMGRNKMIQADTALDLCLGRPVSHGVAVTPQRLLPFHGYEVWSLGYLASQADTMAEDLSRVQSAVSDYGGVLIYLGIPQQYSYFRGDYPGYMDDRGWVLDAAAAEFSRALEERSIPFVQAADAFAAQGNPDCFYSSSDHHYTYRGMLEAYRLLMAEVNGRTGLELKIYTEDDLTFETLPNQFLGSQNRKLFGQWPTEEKIEIAALRQPVPFTRTDNGDPVPASLYALPEPDEFATYSVYMGGDVAETVIRTDRPGLPKLLIWGDSFTNPMETLLWASFDETRSLDLRYYSEMTLTEYIADFRPDVVVCIRDDTAYLLHEGNGAVS